MSGAFHSLLVKAFIQPCNLDVVSRLIPFGALRPQMRLFRRQVLGFLMGS